jgi:RimJ/RimL family protein N-acetyltransferase
MLQIESNSLTIRQLGPDDFDDVLSLHLAEFETSPKTEQAIVRNLVDGAMPDAHNCGIRQEGLLVGTVELYDIKPEEAKLGYLVHPEYRRHGLATRAARLMTRFAFEKVDLTTVRADVRHDNEASKKVLRKAGFAVLPPLGKDWLWFAIDRASYSG